ncbi:hypothetical protein RHGRI_004643 [Rhododendron griersonianum]|uniref:Uncharacterized protein n=1 Tax=Rhododendron griersonianum TaxID=479676 RepID=A0AAV6LC26_9ERIC|nr:hypothetical protein RHGRI_004643 [Rhododendron griersonianum]
MSDAKSGEEIFKPKCTDQFHTVKKDAGHKQDDWTMSHLRSSNLSVKMFFYAANKAVSVNEADFWEKSYPLRQKLLVPLLKIYLLVSEGDSPTFSPPTIIRAQTPSSVVSQYIRDQALLVTDMVLLSLGISLQLYKYTYLASVSPYCYFSCIIQCLTTWLLFGVDCSQLPPESPQRPSSSELLAFSESIKSKFSAASARYSFF